jgi:hypothetical protein
MKQFLFIAAMVAFAACTNDDTVNDQPTDAVTATDSLATDSVQVDSTADVATPAVSVN